MVSQLATTTDHLLVYGRCSKRRGPHIAAPHYRHTSPVCEEVTVRVVPLAHPRSARRSFAAGLAVIAALALAGGAVFGIHVQHVSSAAIAAR
ncbi:MAG TPA: hypothetical protein VGG74_20545 [Kofleriaceae bacterium]|jgi:hypothetical protein